MPINFGDYIENNNFENNNDVADLGLYTVTAKEVELRQTKNGNRLINVLFESQDEKKTKLDYSIWERDDEEKTMQSASFFLRPYVNAEIISNSELNDINFDDIVKIIRDNIVGNETVIANVELIESDGYRNLRIKKAEVMPF